ncbi:MAG: hypothetical protein WBA57_00605 [Elainellaceae cyanobacterium]
MMLILAAQPVNTGARLGQDTPCTHGLGHRDIRDLKSWNVEAGT